MRTVLITGGSNGLGKSFVESYASLDGTQVISIDIQSSSEHRSNVQHHIVDVSSTAAVLRFAEDIRSTAIDLVIHCAGIRGLVPHIEAGQQSVEACETLEVMDVETMTRTFQINTVGTFLLMRALLPNLRLASQPKAVIMSSRMGSLGNNRAGNRAAGGAYAYRASKAALNVVIRSLAVDEPKITFVMCHPGRVETKLVQWREEGAISSQESVKGLLPLIDSWSSKDSGSFYDRFGEVIEW